VSNLPKVTTWQHQRPVGFELTAVELQVERPSHEATKSVIEVLIIIQYSVLVVRSDYTGNVVV